MKVTSETIEYQANDIAMRGTLLRPGQQAGPLPAVLVFPEIIGPSAHVHERAWQLAQAGYAAFVCDLHGGAQVYSTLESALAQLNDLHHDTSAIRARAGGAWEALAARPDIDAERMAALGFCFGGKLALELARSGAGIQATIALHASLDTTRPQDARHIRGRVLACIGSEDPIIPFKQRAEFEEEMRAGGVAWELQILGGAVHSFTNPEADAIGKPDRIRYEPQADRRSWTSAMALLSDVLR
ncbi:dienelactone hydrolase family protein [Novosphingobium kaempferiae]|uniref:dienelactone hydrolase family protein n=1 Tax=Novosphingobium kaempferiae TaxID=2896849 RepID=UPI001E5D132E|nr:dienelactone hydrolase family protein [Novosphingobium kaempferiae]